MATPKTLPSPALRPDQTTDLSRRSAAPIVASGIPGPQAVSKPPASFEDEVHGWNPQLHLWRRSAKE